jgi:hypothetical protein
MKKAPRSNDLGGSAPAPKEGAVHDVSAIVFGGRGAR